MTPDGEIIDAIEALAAATACSVLVAVLGIDLLVRALRRRFAMR